MQKISLNGTWKLKYFPEGKFKIAKPEQLSKIKVDTVEATVPGNVELDLVRAGKIPDPFFANNIFKLRQYEFYEWWYIRSFKTPAGTGNRRAELVFHGIDCFATIWLNGKELGKTANMFVEHRFDVTDILKKSGINELVVRIGSAVNAARVHKIEPCEIAMVVNVEQLSVRKAAHMYGWDICPRAVSAGLWRPVTLELHQPDEIVDLYYFTQQASADEAVLGIMWQFSTDSRDLSGFSLKFSGVCGKSKFVHTVPVKFTSGFETVRIKNPELWWPKGYGKPNLYKIVCRLLKEKKVLDTRTDHIGIRRIELIRTDITTPEKPGEFLFKCNGVPVMCKGSNWVPADAFHSRDAKRIEKILALFDDLQCNILRCWGGNVYEDHPFFDFCDRHGIMVWQDFAFACARYPQDEEFLETVRKEAEQVIRKLRNHSSIILWTGDNECDYSYINYGLDPGKNRITREILPGVVFKCDPYRPYLPSSPYMSPEVVKTGNQDLMPEQHLWGPRDYYKSNFYLNNTAHFASEIGYHGCPNISSIKKFIEKEYLWPWKGNVQWRTHCTDPVEGGSFYEYRVKLMADQIKALFGFEPQNLEDFALASQITQAEAKKFFIEMFRLKKWRKTGIIWWNVMDCWPQFSDAIVDYYFGKKLAYWYIKRVQQQVCIMIDEPVNGSCRVVAGNDSLKPAKGVFLVKDADTGEILMEGKFEVPANENSELGRISVKENEQRMFLIEWTFEDKKYGNHYLLGRPPFSFEKYRKWLAQIGKLPVSFNAYRISK